MKKLIVSALLLLVLHCSAEKSQLIFKTPILPANDTVWVFVPDNSEKVVLPVIFMLHGYSGNFSSWNRIVDLQELSDKYQAIIICPDGLYDCWYVDSPVIKNSRFKTFFFSILLPAIKKVFPIDERKVFITGLSMGGYGSLNLFLHKPEIFRAVASTSGMLWLGEMPEEFGLPKIFGNNPEIFEKWSIINRISDLKNSHKPILIDCGREDFFFNQHLLFISRSKNSDFSFTWKTGPGIHNSAYWKRSVLEHFKFFALWI